MSDIDPWDAPFAYTLSAGGEPSEPIELTHDEKRDLQERLDEMAACRAAAIVNAQNYMVWR